MNILILGSEGFIGRHCIGFFNQKQFNLFGIDIVEQASQSYTYQKISTTSNALVEILTQHQIDVVINAAGSGNVGFSMTNPLVDFEANGYYTIQVLDAIKTIQPNTKYLHISSAAVYGNPQQLPIVETDSTHPISPYGWHKLMAEQICTEYAEIYNIKVATVRPFSVFGPGLKKQMFWDLFQKTKTAPNQVPIFGTGNESRDYIYITDLVNAFACILQNAPMHGEIYNLATGVETTIQQAVSVFFKELNTSCTYKFTNEVRHGDPLNWRADITAIKNLGFIPQFTFEEGVKELCTWLKTV